MCVCRLVSRHKDVADDPALPDECLFGRVGYLYSLLFVQQHLGESAIDKAVIDRVSNFFELQKNPINPLFVNPPYL